MLHNNRRRLGAGRLHDHANSRALVADEARCPAQAQARNTAGFVPEYTTNSPTTNWLTHTATPAVVNDQFTITSTISATREFYRLKQQP